MRKLFLLFIATAISLCCNAGDVTKRGFSWGVDIGSTIDMSGNDISTVDADAYFGLRSGVIRNLAIGSGIHTSLGNSNTVIPVYLLFRTSFTSHPSICFMELKGGYSFNSFPDDYTQQGPFACAGLGFNLYSNKVFRSHLILAYNFYYMKSYTVEDKFEKLNHLHGASIKIGISF